jgi:nucleosome binding factor SPN SPT16 subunit
MSRSGSSKLVFAFKSDTTDLASSCDVAISEGPVNLSWPAIMKTLNEDPYGFYDEGGWTFLTGGAEDSESESSDGSEFNESGDEVSDASSSESGSESDCEF